MGPWVVGGIEINRKEFFFVEVINYRADALKRTILERIQPGILIITNMYQGYWELENMCYFYLIVNHSENFVCPNTGATYNSWKALGVGYKEGLEAGTLIIMEIFH
ncbi:hypothetical protein H311_03987 [Anncaliia algerae PRA109]|nr:hypothetical protein H311_03987 [Anncaliia algerae PRA109]